MSSFLHVILYQPIVNLLIGLYDLLPGHDLGVVILVLTILIRLAIYPLTASTIKSQRSMQELQPKLEAIKKEFPDDKQKQAQATMELYKTHKINPLSSCLPLLIQLPILFALFYVLRDAVSAHDFAKDLYPFIPNPGALNTKMFGLLDLTKPQIILAILTGVSQYFQAKTMLAKKMPPANAGSGSKDEAMAAALNNQMLYIMPLVATLVGWRLPAGLTLYYFFGTVLMVAQQLWMNRGKKAEPPVTQ